MTNNKKQIELYQDAFNFLLDGDHELVVYGVLKKLHIRHDNPYYDDLVQEGMVAFAEKYIQAINLKKSPGSTCYSSIKASTGICWIASEKKCATEPASKNLMTRTDLLAELEDKKKSVGYDDTHIISDELMTQLTREEARYLSLAYDYGMNITEIAKECQCSRTTVYQWRRGVIKKFQK